MPLSCKQAGAATRAPWWERASSSPSRPLRPAPVCFASQELFYGPYFCQVQDPAYFSLAEAVPDGPTTTTMCSLAKQLHMVLVVPVFEQELPGLYYNTAFVVDADGTYLGKYRKTHIPQVQLVGDPGPQDSRAVIVRDLDMGMIEKVRHTWAFYRDRNPAAYKSLVEQ